MDDPQRPFFVKVLDEIDHDEQKSHNNANILKEGCMLRTNYTLENQRRARVGKACILIFFVIHWAGLGAVISYFVNIHIRLGIW